MIERHSLTSREEWVALRSRDVTASDVAAVCGADPYRTPRKVWAEKTGVIAPPLVNPAMKRGRWLEAAVIEAVRDERPSWDLRRAGVYLRDPAIRLGATPDAVASDGGRDGISEVQCKTVRRDIFEREWHVDERGVAVAPLRYQLTTLTSSTVHDPGMQLWRDRFRRYAGQHRHWLSAFDSLCTCKRSFGFMSDLVTNVSGEMSAVALSSGSNRGRS